MTKATEKIAADIYSLTDVEKLCLVDEIPIFSRYRLSTV